MLQPGKDVPCTFCSQSVVATPFLCCAKCEVPIHVDCWELHKACPAYGCASKEVLDPALALYRKRAPATSLVVKEDSSPAHPLDAKNIESRIEAIDQRLGEMSRRAARQGVALVAVLAALVGILVAFPHGFLPYVVPPLLILVSGSAAMLASPEAERHRAMRRKLDQLRDLQLDRQLDSDLTRPP